MKWIIVICLSLTGTAFGQMSAEEAQARLDQRIAQREAQRSQTVTVTVGQLEDMQQSIRQLQAIVTQQQQELIALHSQATQNYQPTPVYYGDDSGYSQQFVTIGWVSSSPVIGCPIYLPGRSCRIAVRQNSSYRGTVHQSIRRR